MNETAMQVSQVVSLSPIVLPAPDRAVDLHMRISAPRDREKTERGGAALPELPIILLSHGHGRSNNLSSLNGYAPLANYWASRGFVVIQPTHLDSKTLTRDAALQERLAREPDAPLYWRARAADMKRILDHLDVIEGAVAHLVGRRFDRNRVAVVGHSMGGHTASMLLGARMKETPPHGDGGSDVSFAEPRIKAGVLLAAPGRGESLSKFAAENYTFFTTIDFSTMTTPTLVIAGDKDESTHLTTAGAAWHADPYVLAPSPKSLVTLFNGEHCLGGISGYDVAETTDENLERVAAVQQLTSAYLRSALYEGDSSWGDACAALKSDANSMGKVESK